MPRVWALFLFMYRTYIHVCQAVRNVGRIPNLAYNIRNGLKFCLNITLKHRRMAYFILLVLYKPVTAKLSWVDLGK